MRTFGGGEYCSYSNARLVSSSNRSARSDLWTYNNGYSVLTLA